MRHKYWKYIMIPASVLIVLAAVFLPGKFLRVQGEAQLSQVQTVPKDSYVAERTAMARRASAQLMTYEKLELIMGTWKSEISSASGEMELSEPGAVRLAREQMGKIFEEKRYPVQIQSQYEHWYSFYATAHKAVETTFHTYGAYFWEIHFEKYDRSEKHSIWMLEDGTIFLAWAKKTDGSAWVMEDVSGVPAESESQGKFPYGTLCPALSSMKFAWQREENEEKEEKKICRLQCAMSEDSFVYIMKYDGSN